MFIRKNSLKENVKKKEQFKKRMLKRKNSLKENVKKKESFKRECS